DFFPRVHDPKRRHLGEALDPGRAQKLLLVAQDVFRVGGGRVGGSWPVEAPDGPRLRVDPGRVDDVAVASDHALVAAGDDLAGFRQALGSRDQRITQIRLDVAWRNGGNRLAFERQHARRRRYPCRGRDRKAPLAVVRLVEHDDVAGVDAMRISDLFLVETPDLRPAPRVLQEFAGDAPQGVALLHR